ncbi:hypothetical protein WA026_020432 [Henosepilachna vigintioctopunctata]|uniref:Uncharacterized protein n=1 Tax=Henosepilachna vigintioctopunctata TaxID=420089 RepID=A0AAW1UMK9_9CUCU
MTQIYAGYLMRSRCWRHRRQKTETKRWVAILQDSDLSPDKRATRKAHWTSGGIRCPLLNKKERIERRRGVVHENVSFGMIRVLGWSEFYLVKFQDTRTFSS